MESQPVPADAAADNSVKRLVIIVGSVIAALLVAGIVVVVVLLNTVRAQAENDEYQACMARAGFEHDAPPPPVGNDEELDEYLNGALAAAERCAPDN